MFGSNNKSKLKDYIKSNLAKGFSKQEIKDKFLKLGYKKEELNCLLNKKTSHFYYFVILAAILVIGGIIFFSYISSQNGAIQKSVVSETERINKSSEIISQSNTSEVLVDSAEVTAEMERLKRIEEEKNRQLSLLKDEKEKCIEEVRSANYGEVNNPYYCVGYLNVSLCKEKVAVPDMCDDTNKWYNFHVKSDASFCLNTSESFSGNLNPGDKTFFCLEASKENPDCEKVIDSEKVYCKGVVITREAISKKDISICNRIETELGATDGVNFCKVIVTRDDSYCFLKYTALCNLKYELKGRYIRDGFLNNNTEKCFDKGSVNDLESCLNNLGGNEIVQQVLTNKT